MSFKQDSPLPVINGGTGATSLTTYAPIVGGTTTTGAVQQATTGMSNSGYVLTSTGSSTLPTWQAASPLTIDGDSGSATGDPIHIETNNASGSPLFSATGSVVTLKFSDTNGNTTIGTNAGNIASGMTGYPNDGLGYGVLAALTSGVHNVSIGAQSMESMLNGSYNVGIGGPCLQSSTADSYLVAIGYESLNNLNGGSWNVAIDGKGALSNLTTGQFNVAIGNYGTAGAYNGAESSNIIINNYNGVAGESNVLRIGMGTGTGNLQLNSAYISGINGITVTGSPVLVSSSDQLGIAVSSARFKENIADMQDSSANIMNLRPVTFTYKTMEDKSIQHGLIAEEVHDVMPSLVTYDKEGLPFTVKYHDLPAMLLNELQRLAKRVDELEQQLSDHTKG